MALESHSKYKMKEIRKGKDSLDISFELAIKFYLAAQDNNADMMTLYLACAMLGKFAKLKLLENMRPEGLNELNVAMQSIENEAEDLIGERLAAKTDG